MYPPRVWHDHLLVPPETGPTHGSIPTLRRNPDCIGSLQGVFIASKGLFQTRWIDDYQEVLLMQIQLALIF